MITTETRENYTWTTNLNVNLKTAEDYACLLSAASFSWVNEVALPMSSNFEQCEKWLKDNIGNSIILSMIELYRNLKKELENRKIGLSDDTVQNWIKENANSIKLATNYMNNLNLVIDEITKKPEPEIPADEVKEEPSQSTEEKIIDVDFTEEKTRGTGEVLDTLSKKIDDIKDGIKNIGSTNQGINFGDISGIGTVPVKIISTDVYGHTIETPAGYRGIIQSNELIKGKDISLETNNRIYLEWKNQKRNEPKNALIQSIISSIDNTKYFVTDVEPISHGLWNMTVQTPDKNILIKIDEGNIMTTDPKFIINANDDGVKDEKQMKTYFIDINEKDFINNVCSNAYDKEYLNKINLIPHAEQLDKYMRITAMKPESFRMISKIIIANSEVMQLVKEASANENKFELDKSSTVKSITIKNIDTTISLKNGKLTITKKDA